MKLHILVSVHQPPLPGHNVKKCVADFKRGRDGTGVDTRTGRPKSESATIDAYVEVIHGMVMNDRRVTLKHIAEILGITVGRFILLCQKLIKKTL